MLVLRTSNFQGATIRPIVPRRKHFIVFIVRRQLIFIPRASSKINFTITAEIQARSLVNFYRQYADTHMNLKFM